MAAARANTHLIDDAAISSVARRSLIVPDFFDGAEGMRAEFDERMRDLRSTKPDRFVWDYWHLPGQYTYVRTYGDRYFSQELTAGLMRRLGEWGLENLGCGSIRPPWLSYYVEGCGQELHADVPHGPWAYVFSLTRWEGRGFSGGETLMLRPESLDFWRSFDSDRDLEADDIVEQIPTTFNQLTVFDARIPHAVKMVRGTHDPLDSRIVMHGWFEYPELTVSDALDNKRCRAALVLALTATARELARFGSLTGLLTVRLVFGEDGSVVATEVLSNTLVSTVGQPDQVDEALQLITRALRETQVAPKTGPGWAVLPFRL